MKTPRNNIFEQESPPAFHTGGIPPTLHNLSVLCGEGRVGGKGGGTLSCLGCTPFLSWGYHYSDCWGGGLTRGAVQGYSLSPRKDVGPEAEVLPPGRTWDQRLKYCPQKRTWDQRLGNPPRPRKDLGPETVNGQRGVKTLPSRVLRTAGGKYWTTTKEGVRSDMKLHKHLPPHC